MASFCRRRALWTASSFSDGQAAMKFLSRFPSKVAQDNWRHAPAIAITSLSQHRDEWRRGLSSQPFYGAPGPFSSRYVSCQDDLSSKDPDRIDQQQNHHYLPPLTSLQRLATLVHSSLTALRDPTRADAVAAVGEVTGSYALSKMMSGMERDEIGRRILHDRPIVDESVARRAAELWQQHNEKTDGTAMQCHKLVDTRMSFGAAYAEFLQTHNFHPSGRDAVRFVSDPNLAYVMTRYRQCHDYWHVLTGLPPTVLGELALKWIEFLQTGLPLAALSATGGALGVSGLSSRERDILWEVYLPWAIRVGGTMRANALMCVYYEEELETDLGALRERMGVEVAPTVEP